MKFSAVGMNSPLLISGNLAEYQSISSINSVIIGLAFIIFLLSIYLDKMIAVETLNTLLMVYFGRLLLIKNIFIFGVFNNFKYISGYN